MEKHQLLKKFRIEVEWKYHHKYLEITHEFMWVEMKREFGLPKKIDYYNRYKLIKEKVRRILNNGIDLTKDNILKTILSFAAPIFISNIFQQFYNTMDTVIVGHYLGESSLAAIGAAGAIYELLTGFSIGVGNGLSLVTARCFGAKNKDMLKKSVAGSLVIGMAMTMVIVLLSQFGMYPLLRLLGTPENIIEETYSYIHIISLFMGIMFVYNLLSGLLRAVGNSFMPLIFLIISSAINIGLDLLLLVKFHMGVQGTAVATVISQGISAMLCLIYMVKKSQILIPGKSHFNIKKELYMELAGQGFSMGFMMGIVCSGTIILQKAINGFGYLIIAGHTTARKINSFCIMPCATLAMAISTFVSQNRGAGHLERIRQGVKTGMMLSVVWGLAAIVILHFFSGKLVSLTSGSDELQILHNAARYLKINSIFYAVLGILLILRNSLQAIGEKMIPLISSCIEFTGKIVFVILFIPHFGYLGVILCEPVIWVLMCIQLIYSFYWNSYIKGIEK